MAFNPGPRERESRAKSNAEVTKLIPALCVSEGRAGVGGGEVYNPSTFQLKVSGDNHTTTSASGRERGRGEGGSKQADRRIGKRGRRQVKIAAWKQSRSATSGAKRKPNLDIRACSSRAPPPPSVFLLPVRSESLVKIHQGTRRMHRLDTCLSWFKSLK